MQWMIRNQGGTDAAVQGTFARSISDAVDAHSTGKGLTYCS